MPKESIKNERVAERIKAGVEALGVRGLAGAVGISPAIITRYMQGKVGEPTAATMQKLADHFGVSVAYLRGQHPDYTYEQEVDFMKRVKSGKVLQEELRQMLMRSPGTHDHTTAIESVEKYKELVTAFLAIPLDKMSEARDMLMMLQGLVERNQPKRPST